jgi:hypothetical protein
LYLAIWNDDAAAEQSERIACDLTIPNIRITGAEWMDPYFLAAKGPVFSNRFERDRDRRIEYSDYPVFIKLDLENQ